MDEFKDFTGEIVDLDDLTTYPEELREMNVHELFSKCMNRAGRSLFYMKFLHGDISFGGQWIRVETLCEELSDIWNNKRRFNHTTPSLTILNEDEYRLLLMKWLYRFEDEVENQC